MRLEIRHETSYSYTAPVFLEPQTLRLRPRSDAGQRLESFRLQIDPAPDGTAEIVDIDGNSATRAWFLQTHDHLRLSLHARVETLRTNPFDFIWDGPRGLPVQYSHQLERALMPYLQAETGMTLRGLGEEVARLAHGDAQEFVVALAARLHGGWRQVLRREGDPLAPAVTLQRGEGSCRDLTVLYAAISRLYGFATRFVSGYHYVEGAEEHELHAWAEVFLPGGGWRGFDPSTGLAAGEGYVALAAAADPALAAPVSGGFRGSARALPLEASLRVTRLDT